MSYQDPRRRDGTRRTTVNGTRWLLIFFAFLVTIGIFTWGVWFNEINKRSRAVSTLQPPVAGTTGVGNADAAHTSTGNATNTATPSPR